MKCPYCKKEMSAGYIPATKMALMWIPENEKVPLFIFSKAKGGVNLTKVPFFKRQKAKSYYCGNCKIVITPVMEEN